MESPTPTGEAISAFPLPNVPDVPSAPAVPDVPAVPNVSPLTESELRSMLAVSFRNGAAWIGIPHGRVQHFLKDDLNIERLAEVSPYFSILGKAKPPQALHHQEALGLEILVTERMDTHLLWAKGKIFIKPLPKYLIDPQFWSEHLECPEGCSYSPEFKMVRAAGLVRRQTKLSTRTPCEHSKLWKCAMGFLYSYIVLITHESDFRIAKAKNLLPDDMDFAGWKAFVERTLNNGRLYGQIDERFTYGELSMARLNTLLMVKQPRRYFFQENDSYGFLRDHSSQLPSVSRYMGAVVASMQVRPTIPKFKGNKALKLALVMLFVCFWVLSSVLSIRGKGLQAIAVKE
ncbi:uncharacterized protein Triagg1_3727 [Trichoderma aggressivum f. europaeum]|uniref:Uncharacterized protein n=1 Tax=Trichoderma aggressivum f. europaeum TaxID=173218 RepID=A0AAE1JCG1_9HYPO|nr:hypothetical protein Triagg1_3727 [Trichoderma aggressivum f. europaeum]